jgi:nucleoside-diphosphate-sugar epimerase
VAAVVVTGAAGTLGSRVVARLLDHPQVERVVGLDVVPVEGGDPRLDARVMDLSAPSLPDDPELVRAFDGAQGVLHLAWTVPDGRGAGPDGEARAAADNQRALRRVLAAAAKAAVPAVVHVSSATVYGAWPDNQIPLNEDARLRPNPEFPFAVSKAEAERALAEWADQHPSATVAVLRPAATVGADGRPLYRAFGVTRSPRLADESRPVQYLHIDDLASAVVLAWERRLDGVYNVAPDTGIAEEAARALAGGVARWRLPGRVGAVLAALGWRLWRRGVPIEALAYATHSWVVAPDLLKAAGWVPQFSSEEALVSTDQRIHWDDLPPGRRQNLNLALIAAGAATALGGAALAVAALRRRRTR